MEQFNIQENRPDPALIEQAVSRAVNYINRWKLKQIRDIIASTTKPVCVEINPTKFFVGQFLVVNERGLWAAYKLMADEADNYFTTKKSAICYVLCMQKSKQKLAKEIKKADADLLTHKTNLAEYNYNFEQAVKRGDQFKISFYMTMIHESEAQINNAKTILQKSLNLAKYFNIWE